MSAKNHSVKAPSGRQKRILVVDDHPLIRFGLTTVFAKHPGYRVCGEAVDHHEALAKIRELNPDLVTVDLTLNNSHGLELIKDIHVQYPTLLILVVSVHNEFLNARRVISAGAHGYLTKQEPLTQVLVAVERIFGGEVYVSHQVTSQMALHLAGRRQDYQVPEIHNLSDRELEIFELTGDGLSIRQIAAKLKLAISTIEVYRARIKEKLCLSNYAQVLQTAIRYNRSDNLNGKPVAETSAAMQTTTLNRRFQYHECARATPKGAEPAPCMARGRPTDHPARFGMSSTQQTA